MKYVTNLIILKETDNEESTKCFTGFSKPVLLKIDGFQEQLTKNSQEPMEPMLTEPLKKNGIKKF